MESESQKKHCSRVKRKLRTRKRLRGCAVRPRLMVLKSNKHIHVQLIDDEASVTLASTSTISKDFKSTAHNRRNKESGKQLGLKIAELAREKNVKQAIFVRGPFKYHGVIAAVADGAREGGLEV